MKSTLLPLLAAVTLAACGDPVAEQAAVDARYTPTRADALLAVDFAPGTARLDPAQERELRAMVGGRGQRDEFVVLTDGFGGPIQQSRSAQVAHSLAQAGARWVSASVEPAMARGVDQVVVVRSQYRLAALNCPTYTPSTMWNPNESAMPGLGCADAYNMGQMLYRPRDAVVGRSGGPADGTVTAAAIARYRDGKVPALNTTGMSMAGPVGTGAGTSTGGGGGGGTGSSTSN